MPVGYYVDETGNTQVEYLPDGVGPDSTATVFNGGGYTPQLPPAPTLPGSGGVSDVLRTVMMPQQQQALIQQPRANAAAQFGASFTIERFVRENFLLTLGLAGLLLMFAKGKGR